MEKRVFRGDRLFNLIMWIVNIISVPLLIWSMYFFWNRERFVTGYLDAWKNCIDKYGLELSVCTDQWYGLIDQMDNNINRAFRIGLGLPILFYGSTGLYKYLFPKQVIEETIKKSKEDK